MKMGLILKNASKANCVNVKAFPVAAYGIMFRKTMMFFFSFHINIWTKISGSTGHFSLVEFKFIASLLMCIACVATSPYSWEII